MTYWHTILKHPLIRLIIISIMIRLFFIVIGTETVDIKTYRAQGELVLNQSNIYTESQNLFPYTPFSLIFPTKFLMCAEKLALPFHMLPKLMYSFFDILIGITIYIALMRQTRSSATAYNGAQWYLLCPATIFISSAQGNAIAGSLLLFVWSWLISEWHGRKTWPISAFLLGIAIAWRNYPVLFIPFLITRLGLTRKEIIQYCAIAAAPGLACSLPYLILSPSAFVTELISYSGQPDYGLLALYRAILSLMQKTVILDLSFNFEQVIIRISQLIFGIAYIGVLFKGRKQLTSASSFIMIFLLLYVIYTGIATQYLLLIIPFALITQTKQAHAYIISASIAITGFYIVYFPDILFGIFATHIHIPLSTRLIIEIIALAVFSITCLKWLLYSAYNLCEKKI